MTSVKSESDSMNSDNDEEAEFLDPRIQIELERLNTCTDEINKLETELDEANTTFRMLLNESMRRLKVLTCKLGSCIDRARPYYEAVDIAKKAQAECQRAAVKFQRANEIHQAAKETVALAETRFLSNQHEWQFDSAWQEMLNHAIIKVTEAEHQRTESGQEHQKRATLFNVAEQRVAILEQKLKRTINKSRPYFEEKALCQEQLDTQKKRVEELQTMISKVKSDYAGSLKRLEAISEEIHQRRRNKMGSGSGSPLPRGPREPGVGAELNPNYQEEIQKPVEVSFSPDLKKRGSNSKWSGDDLESELDKFEVCSLGSLSVHTSSHVSESEDYDDEDLDELRQKVKELSMAEVRSDTWETELAESILRLDNAMLERECNRELREIAGKPCGSPIREQDCNRELTAIATCRPEDGTASEAPVPVESDESTNSKDISSDENGGDGLESVPLNSPVSPSEGADLTEITLTADSGRVPNKSNLVVRKDAPTGSKSLHTVLAEEESKRSESVTATLGIASGGVNSMRNELRVVSLTPKIEQLSAVALNEMVHKKDVGLLNNTPSKSIFNAILSSKCIDLETRSVDNKEKPVNSNNLDYNNVLDKDVESSDCSPIQSAAERKQSIGAAASKLLNSSKIESLRANLNENILLTIKDVSESVLNRLTRQDSNPFKSDNSSACQLNSSSSNPFKIDGEVSSNNEKNNIIQKNNMIQKSLMDQLEPNESIVHLQPNTSIVQPQANCSDFFPDSNGCADSQIKYPDPKASIGKENNASK